eukprot:6198466-Pleurochrysis_carterae.AAC.1
MPRQTPTPSSTFQPRGTAVASMRQAWGVKVPDLPIIFRMSRPIITMSRGFLRALAIPVVLLKPLAETCARLKLIESWLSPLSSCARLDEKLGLDSSEVHAVITMSHWRAAACCTGRRLPRCAGGGVFFSCWAS